uniref:Uncharacterized protein n=1 Tax=Mycena chlorophos TaxID=658473 RepID=A0ABQ0LT14_MYCCL|nr:predicted protein [Mycena chlorophos]
MDGWRCPTWTIMPWRWDLWQTKVSALRIAVAGNLVHIVQALLSRQTLTDYHWSAEIVIAVKNQHISMTKFLAQYKFPQDQLDSALFSACHASQTELVRMLLGEMNANPAARKNRKENVLHVAASAGNVDIVQLLLNKGIDHSPLNNNEQTPLYCAADHGHAAVVQLLLNAGAEHSWEDERNSTPLHAAANGGHIEVVELLLSISQSCNRRTNSGYTPLHQAARGGYSKIVKVLLDNGANPHQIDADSETPMHAAASGNHSQVVKILIDAGADCKAIDTRGNTPFHAALYTSRHYRGLRSGIVKLFLDIGADYRSTNKAGETPLHLAAAAGQVECVHILLTAGASWTAKDHNGSSTLQVAMDWDQAIVVEHLLNAQINGMLTEHRHTILQWAISREHITVVEQLIKAGVECHTLEDSKTLLHCAALGNLEIMQVLLDAGAAANCNTRNRHGRTPLHVAVQENNSTVIPLLIKYGSNCYATDNRGQSPLFIAGSIVGGAKSVQQLLDAGYHSRPEDCQEVLRIAAGRGFGATVQVLIGAGVNWDAADEYGQTPLHLAACNGHPEVVQMLLKAGADQNLRTYDSKRTVLHVAAIYGHKKVVQILLAAGANHKAKDGYGRTADDLAKQGERRRQRG